MRYLYALLLAIALTSCASVHYRTSTGFDGLSIGMTKLQFVEWNRSSYVHGKKEVIGGRPIDRKLFGKGEDVWEVLVFQVYSVKKDSIYGDTVRRDHLEYILFKNNILVEWGRGIMPISMR